MDIIILSTAAIGIALTLLIIWVLKRSDNKTATNDNNAQNNILPGARRRQLGHGRTARQRPTQAEEENEDEPLDIDLQDKKVGAKKLAKLQAKAEKKAQREAEDKDRQERKKKQAVEDEIRNKAEEKEKEEERKREEEERLIREEKERREYEEYLKLKEGFSIESEGFEEGDAESGNSLQDFVTYVKKSKVVVIEDIAAQFKLKTQQAIDRIQQMQADGILTGVIDDRGKFIYISREELEAVAKFVNQRGRVSIAELVDSSNMLIDLTPQISQTA